MGGGEQLACIRVQWVRRELEVLPHGDHAGVTWGSTEPQRGQRRDLPCEICPRWCGQTGEAVKSSDNSALFS